jgi:hypothetical protein
MRPAKGILLDRPAKPGYRMAEIIGGNCAPRIKPDPMKALRQA